MKKHFINFSILRRNRDFGLLYFGQFISFFGTMITNVAVPFQIYQLTHSTIMVGLVSLAQLLPLLFTALIGGVFADRYHRRLLLLVTEISLAIGCLFLALNCIHRPSIWILFVVAVLMSAVTGLHRPALDSMVQQLVKKEDFADVGSLGNFKFSVGVIAGPALGGLIIAHFGIVVTYLVDLLTFAASLGALLLMTHLPRPQANHDGSTWQALKSGFNYATSRQELLGTYFVDFVAMIFGMPMALFPAIAEQHGGPQFLGILYSAPAVGTLLISLMSGWTKEVKRHGLAVAIAATLWGVAIIFFGLASNIWVALFFLMLAGAFDTISGIFRGIMWNTIIPNEYRGRLAGIEMISYLSGPKLGDAEAGLVAGAFGISASIVSGGVLCVLGVVVMCYFLPKFLRYRDVSEELSTESAVAVSQQSA